MSAASPEPLPADDLMAVAEAAGVVVPRMTDDVLAAVLANWSRAAAGIAVDDLEDLDPGEPIPYYVVVCELCADSGLVEIRSALTGAQAVVTCPTCGGES